MSHTLLSRCIGCLFGVGGAFTVALALMLVPAPELTWFHWATVVFCSAMGTTMLVLGQRLPLLAYQLAPALIVVLHALFVLQLSHPVQVVAFTSLLAVAAAVGTLMFLPVAASVYLVMVVASITLIVVKQPGAGPSEWVLLVGLCALTASLVATMASAREAAELDVLTGLVNRRGLTRRLEELRAAAPRRQQLLTLALVDLDHFKVINDTQGHLAGDQALRAVASSWAGHLGAGPLLGRWGGDEFALVLRGDEAVAEEVVGRLRALLHGGLSCTAGLAVLRPDESVAELLDRADAALYAAKRTQRSTTRRWTAEVPTAKTLMAALRAGQIQVHHQPVVEVATGVVLGSEALARWPQAGVLMPPGAWLPLAEASGMMSELGRYVAERACRDAVTWPLSPGQMPLSVAVNACAAELVETDYATYLLQMLARVGLEPRRLVVEVVEQALAEESAVVLGNIATLRQAGVRIAIDDFGTGMSSLRRLTRLPVDIVKVDRCFTSEIDSADGQFPVLEAILGLASDLRLAVVVEGVESREQALWLDRHGCREAQGFLWSAAVPGSRFAALVSSDPASPGAVHGRLQM